MRILRAIYYEILHRIDCKICRYRPDIIESIKEWYYEEAKREQTPKRPQVQPPR